MRRFAFFAAALVTAALAATLTTRPADAGELRAGMLTCQIAPGIGLVIVSQKQLECTYEPHHGRPEYYTGRITRVGVDLGFTGPQVLAWAVLVASHGRHPGTLEGAYGGVSAQATAVLGIGANALLGGSHRSIVLQPISVTAQVGLNVAAGITGLRLYSE